MLNRSDGVGFLAWTSVLAHIWLVVLVAGYLTVATGQPIIGANIGAGLGQIVLAGLGLPWSALDWLGLWPRRPQGRGEIPLLYFCACLNVALHATIAMIVVRRRA